MGKEKRKERERDKEEKGKGRGNGRKGKGRKGKEKEKEKEEKGQRETGKGKDKLFTNIHAYMLPIEVYVHELLSNRYAIGMIYFDHLRHVVRLPRCRRSCAASTL